MNPQFIEARELIIKAREALRRGDRASAWKMGEQAALLAPDMENVWLILAASDPDPHEALAYAQKALQINASSTRAHKAVEWAKDKLRQAQVTHEAAVSFAQIAPVAIAETPQQQAKPDNRTWIYAASFLGIDFAQGASRPESRSLGSHGYPQACRDADRSQRVCASRNEYTIAAAHCKDSANKSSHTNPFRDSDRGTKRDSCRDRNACRAGNVSRRGYADL